jgi:hypothetical protein
MHRRKTYKSPQQKLSAQHSTYAGTLGEILRETWYFP